MAIAKRGNGFRAEVCIDGRKIWNLSHQGVMGGRHEGRA